MKSYITGQGGFIGQALTKRLDGDIVAIPHEFIQTTKLTPFDFFFFCSSYGNLIHQKDDEQIFRANVTDLLSVLLKVKEQKFQSFVFLSTSSVKLRTQTMYSRAKKAAEEILLSFKEKYDLPICIIRPFTITGVGDHPIHLIPSLIHSAFSGVPMNFVATPVHDFLDIDDFVSGVLALSQSGARGIYELGTSKMRSNLEILQMVEAITGKDIKVNFVDYLRPYDNTEWVSTNLRARGYGWVPRKKLTTTINEMVDAYRKEHYAS